MEDYGNMIDDIIQKHEELNKRLQIALATMERSNKIFEIKKEIIENQKQCPHFSDKYNWAVVDSICPYCGFHFSAGGMTE